MLKILDLSEAQRSPSLPKLVVEILEEGLDIQYKSIPDKQGNALLLEVSVSPLSETEKIHLIEFKSIDDQSLYDEITFVSAHNRELFNNSPDAIAILDSIGKVVDTNNTFSQLFGYSRIESIGRDIDSLVVPASHREEAKALTQRVLDQEQLFNRSLFPTAILDENEFVLDVNAKFEEFFGYKRSEAIGNLINQLVVPQEFEEEANEFKSVILKNQTMIKKTKRKHKNGDLLDVEAVGCPVLIGGRVQGFFAMYRDIRVEEEALHSLKVLLNTDSLTGLYSRKFMYEEITCRLESTETKQGSRHSFSLIYVDLDQFKQINDTYGHETGDHLLIAVADRLRQALGPDAYVSRIGGDEFLALLGSLSPIQIVEKMSTLRTQLSAPFDIDGHQLRAIASLGVAHYPEHGITADELISSADGQMYEEKKTRRIQNNPIRVEPFHTVHNL